MACLLARRASSAASLRRSPALISRSFASTPLRSGEVGLSDVKYTAKAKGLGGRNGHVELVDAQPGLSLDLAMPKELGGSGRGHNPEQLFSSGYSACFLGAMGLVARNMKIKLPEGVSVEAQTSIGTPKGGEGFGIAVKMVVRGEGTEISLEDLEKVVEAGHQACPYSKATRNNVEVTFDVEA